jgi:hypothetical protein
MLVGRERGLQASAFDGIDGQGEVKSGEATWIMSTR